MLESGPGNRDLPFEDTHRKLLNDSLAANQELQSKLNDLENSKREPIAVIGIGCRFPGSIGSPENYWKLLENGVDAIGDIPADRWDKETYYDPNPDARGKMYTREGGFLGPRDLFDPHFFKISPREALYMDPQQRLLLEVAWEAIENANIPADSLYRSDMGVFVGISVFDYANLIVKHLSEADANHAIGTGCALSAASGRLSYVLGLTGPSISIDTACSSSLVAVQAACDSLRNRDCTAALSGGVNMMFSPFNHIVLSRARMLAPDGRSKAFDESADGYGRSEGAGLVVLKRLADAVSDNDNVLALILGGAVNQGGATGGLTVPNGPAQQQVIRKALLKSGINPNDVDYVEAHGTGTPLGDPIELNALGEVFRQGRSNKDPLLVGSAKTNLGHMEAAAGIGGLIKVILQLQKGAIAPHLHMQHPSTRVSWDELPIKVPNALTSWPRSPHRKRVAGVSSFGFSGTNAHLILQEAPPPPEEKQNERERPLHLLAFSAKTEAALIQLSSSYASDLESRPDTSVADICYTANVGRAHFDCRAAVLSGSSSELKCKLNAFGQGKVPSGVFKNVRPMKRPKIAFLFAGVESQQYVGIGRDLYESQPVFRDVVEKCDWIVRRIAHWSLLDLLYSQGSGARLSLPNYSLPALLSIEYALAALWRTWGVKPSIVMGHGLGEYAAAAVAGIFSLEQALVLACAQGNLTEELPSGGGMTDVRSSVEPVVESIQPYLADVAIAAIDGPRHTVISGELTKLRQISSILDGKGIRSKERQVSHAFFSPLIKPILDKFAEVTGTLTYSSPHIDFLSTVTASLVTDRSATAHSVNASYWIRHLTSPVLFGDSMKLLSRLGCTTLVEIGPKSTLIEKGRQCVDAEMNWMASLKPGRGDWEQILQSAAEMYVHGLDLNWQGFDKGYERRKVSLPTYPFQRESYWFKAESNAAGA